MDKRICTYYRKKGTWAKMSKALRKSFCAQCRVNLTCKESEIFKGFDADMALEQRKLETYNEV